MNRITVRRLDVVRTANIAAALYAVAVIVISLVFVLPFALLAGAAGSQSGFGGTGALVGAGVVGVLIFAVIGSVIYAVIGWIMTAIVVVLYNFVAGRIGGLQMDVTIEGPGLGGPGYGTPPYGYQPGYGAQSTPYPGYGQPPAGQPPTPPPGWGPPQG